jgi:MFS family permease
LSSIDAHPTPAQARGLRWFWWGAFFAGANETIVLEYLPLFALAFGASNGEIGLLAAAVGLAATLAFTPGAWLSSRWRYRKPFILATGWGAAQLLFIPLAVVPLLCDVPAAVRFIIALAAIRAFVFSLASPAWTALAADLVPAGIRGRYFSTRNFVYGAGGLAGLLLVALLLVSLGSKEGWLLVWLLVLVAGLSYHWAFNHIPEREFAPAGERPRPCPCPRTTLLSDANFQAYGGTVLVWSISLYMAAPFFNVHLVKNLGASPLWVGSLLVVMSVFGLLGQLLFGKMVDIRGARWVMAVCGLLIPFLPWAWYFVNAPYQVIAINAMAGVAWAGYTLASFNFLLAISPPGQQRYYAAAYQTLVYLSTFLGPLLGGAIAAAYGIKTLFLLSGAGRMLACLLFVRFVREGRMEIQPHPRPVEQTEALTA